MNKKPIKFISALTLGMLSIGVVTPIVVSSCGEQVSMQVESVQPGPVDSIQLDKNELDLAVGETAQLTATVYPETATNKNVTWSSSDKSIATVDENGLVKAISMGYATIIVSTKDGGKTATCEVTVKPKVQSVPIPVSVKCIQFDKSEIELFDGQSKQLSVRFIPETATNKNVTWSSSDKSIATVDENGLVKAISMGYATIIVSTKDGGKTATCQVKVSKKQVLVGNVKVEAVRLDKNELELAKGGNEQLKATVYPENATNKYVVWTSSDEKVATVSQNGLVTAVSVGTASITAEIDNGKKATCHVKVTSSVTDVELDKNDLWLFEDDTWRLNAKVLPETATNKNVTWSSSDKSIAAVDENGLVKAISMGCATITVTTLDGGKTATCNVVVLPILVKQVQLDKSKLELNKGDTKQLAATVWPENASYKRVIWISSDDKVATVSQKGKVKAINEGLAIITVTSVDGGATATCKVTVKPSSVESVRLDKDKIELAEGKTEQLTATFLSENATNKNVTWSSSDTSIVIVDQNGLVKAVKTGKATITVTTEDGSKTTTCEINVIAKKVPVKSIQLDRDNLLLFGDETYQLKATVLPKNATNKKVTWSSSDENIATVDQTGLVTAVYSKKIVGSLSDPSTITNKKRQVTAIFEGTATITVTTEDGSKTATCEVTVFVNQYSN